MTNMQNADEESTASCVVETVPAAAAAAAAATTTSNNEPQPPTTATMSASTGDEQTAITEPAADDALAREREEKKRIVIDAIAARCREPSDFEDVREFGRALLEAEGDDGLELEVLSGGETNFSYKVSLKQNPSKSVFAKISFSYALWNPDKSVLYDLERVENEFLAMNRFAGIMGGFGDDDGGDEGKAKPPPPVARPYFCVDVMEGEAKLLVTEWSSADVQFSNQFMNGRVDIRVIDGVARALAELNLTPVDDGWNEGCRACFQSLHPQFKQIFRQFVELPTDQIDACAAYCKDTGLKDLEAMVDEMDAEYMNVRQVYNHNDTKLFNILVEEQPSVDTFGERGSFALCDWEMSIKGKSGKDIGIFWAWPVACIMCHAVQGHKAEAYHILDTCMRFWDEYVKVLVVKGGKDEDYLVDAFKGALGGHFLYLLFGFYALGINKEDLPIEGVPDDLAAEAKGAMGLAGLKTGEVAYLGKHSEYNLEELKGFFRGTVVTEIEKLLKLSAGRTDLPKAVDVPYRHESGRRCSDSLLLEFAARRRSVLSAGGDNRASIYEHIVVPDSILNLVEDDDDD